MIMCPFFTADHSFRGIKKKWKGKRDEAWIHCHKIDLFTSPDQFVFDDKPFEKRNDQSVARFSCAISNLMNDVVFFIQVLYHFLFRP